MRTLLIRPRVPPDRFCEETPMTTPTIPTRRKPACKLTSRVQRAPCFPCVVITGEASFDQAEVLAGQLLRIRLERYSRVVCVLAELTFLISLAMGALVAYRRGLCRRGVEIRLTNLSAQVWLA